MHGNILYDSHRNLRWVGCVNDVNYQLKYNYILFSSLDWKISSDWEKTTPCCGGGDGGQSGTRGGQTGGASHRTEGM